MFTSGSDACWIWQLRKQELSTQLTTHHRLCDVICLLLLLLHSMWFTDVRTSDVRGLQASLTWVPHENHAWCISSGYEWKFNDKKIWDNETIIRKAHASHQLYRTASDHTRLHSSNRTKKWLTNKLHITVAISFLSLHIVTDLFPKVCLLWNTMRFLNQFLTYGSSFQMVSRKTPDTIHKILPTGQKYACYTRMR